MAASLTHSGKAQAASGEQVVEVKSKFDAEFRRFAVNLGEFTTFELFQGLLAEVHLLRSADKGEQAFHIFYVDQKDNDLLPINNTDNYLRAMKNAKPPLRLVIQRQGECEETFYTGRRGHGQPSLLTSMLHGGTPKPGKSVISISQPSEFRQVSAIIDVDVVPETCRRVRLLKHGSDKPLGFYIRDGTSVRVTPSGLEKVPGIFISRLLAGGLAESTGLLAVNDEVLEVNGIEVAGKSLDQVTDMMVANSSNLIITVKPANQRTIMSSAPRRGSFSRNSNMSQGSMLSRSSTQSNTNDSSTGGHDYDHDEEDEIRDLTKTVSNHQESLHSRYGQGGPPSTNSKKPVLHL
jgi:partitioning defective protein 6